MIKTTLLLLISIPCFFYAYRFTSHGVALGDSFCVVLGIVASLVGIALVAGAVWFGKTRLLP